MIFILLGTLLYFIIGFVSARVMWPALISRATKHKGDKEFRENERYLTKSYRIAEGRWHTYSQTTINRKEVMSSTRNMIFGWPVVLPVLGVSASVNKAIDKVDPAVYDLQQEKIAELEKELGM